MRIKVFSYRYAEEILQHDNYRDAWDEMVDVFKNAPLFIYPGKSARNAKLEVVQQVMNTYFDRRLAVDNGWDYHPLATGITGSNLTADFSKSFRKLTIQMEVQLGNMARWYSDIFKFQTAYSQRLIQMGISVVPMNSMAVVIDSNITNYERVLRELPSALLSISLPILVIGLEPDANTTIVDLRDCNFNNYGEIIGRGGEENRYRIVDGYINGVPMNNISPNSPTGPRPV